MARFGCRAQATPIWSRIASTAKSRRPINYGILIQQHRGANNWGEVIGVAHGTPTKEYAQLPTGEIVRNIPESPKTGPAHTVVLTRQDQAELEKAIRQGTFEIRWQPNRGLQGLAALNAHNTPTYQTQVLYQARGNPIGSANYKPLPADLATVAPTLPITLRALRMRLAKLQLRRTA